MQTFKKILIFFILFIIANICISFLLIPYYSGSDKMWKDFQKESNPQIIFIGSSLAKRTLNPYVIENEIGITCFNMGTLDQCLDDSYIALQAAIFQKIPKKIILVCDYSRLKEKNNKKARIIFWKGLSNSLSFWKRILMDSKFIFSKENIKEPDSINYLYPWIYNQNQNGIFLSHIIENIKDKIKNEKFNENKMVKGKLYYIGKGFEGVNQSLDPNKISSRIEINPNALEKIEKMAELCKKNNIDFLLINTPHPVYDVIAYGDKYFDIMNTITKFFKEKKINYYDFSLIKPDIFVIKEEYYYDYEHFNYKGAKEFSKAFANFIKLREKEKDLSKYFYTKEEYLKSIKYISTVNFKTSVTKNGINIVARAYTGSTVNVEYEISIYDNKKNEYKVIKEYNKDSEYFYSTDKKGKYKIRVNARQIGSNSSYEKYCEKEIIFKD